MSIEEVIELAVERGVAKALAQRPSDELISVKDAAKLLGVAESTVRLWVEEGLLKRYGSARVLRLRRVEVLNVQPRSRASEKTTEELVNEILDRPRRGK